jgi:hypothetical protein
MFQVKLSEATAARRRIPVLLVDITDGFTPETGVVTPTVNISKNGATIASGAGTWTEIGNGQYYYEFTTGEVDTLGWIAVNIEKATVSRDYNTVVQIMAYDAMDVVRLGLTAFPAVASGSTGAIPTTGSGANQIAVNGSGAITSVVSVSGSVGSVTGAVGSVTGSVGSVTGAVGSVTGAVGSVAAGGITAASVATGAIDADALATDAVNEIADGILTRSLATAGAASNIAITSIVSSVFQAVNTLAVDDKVRFIGTAPTSYVVGTSYYVMLTSLTSTTFQLSTAPGGLSNATVSTGAFTARRLENRDMLSAMQYLRNKVDISGSTMTVYTEDDTTGSWTSALTTTAGLHPVTSSDPS